jgi:uncharacterized protein (TIGR02611 family)
MISSMIDRAKQNWRRFKQDKPGRRFQDRYHRHRQDSNGRPTLGRIFNIVGGTAITLAGIFLLAAPGPGWLTIFVGLGMLASESLLLSRFLDWTEVRLRKLAQLALDVWTSSSLARKALIVLIILIFVAALGYVAYYLVLGR